MDQRPCSPSEAETTSTKAATSWLVVRSRSRTASTVNAARSRPAGGSRRRHPALGSPGIGGGKLDLEPALQPPLVAPDRPDLGSRVAIDHAPMMRAASKPAFLAPSIATHATGTPGGICTAESSASRPPRLLPRIGPRSPAGRRAPRRPRGGRRTSRRRRSAPSAPSSGPRGSTRAPSGSRRARSSPAPRS